LDILKQVFNPAPIAKAELFNHLMKEEMDYVLDHCCIINLRSKAKLFSVGHKADRFYMLLEGAILIYKTREDGGRDELARFANGDIIGDFDFARKAVYDANAEASEDSVLIVFPAIGFTMDEIAQEQPAIVSRILLNAIVMMTGRIKYTHSILLENLSWANELHRRAYEDPGTGLWKQVFITDEINQILEEPMSLIMLKPDHFKILVDSRGHEAGDKAMVKIALILKSITRKLGRGWAIRFKSNETGLLINRCTEKEAERIAKDLSSSIRSIKPVPAEKGIPEFVFSGTIAWSVWPDDCSVWEELFTGTYHLLLETWKTTMGNEIIRYNNGKKAKESGGKKEKK
jgi:diguanylate cyclase (GGDEF)-like protein